MELPSFFSRLLGNQDFFLNIFVSICIRIIGALATVVLSFVVAHKLGATEAGLFFLAFTTITILSAFSRMGFDNSIVRFVAAAESENAWSDIRFVISRVLMVVSMFSIFTAATLFLFSDQLALHLFSKPELSPVLKTIAPGVVGLSIFTLLAMVLQGLHRVVPSVFVINICVSFFTVVAIFFFGAISATDVSIFWSASSLITVAIAAWLLMVVVKNNDKPQALSWRELFASSMPLWVVIMMSQCTLWSGQLVAGVYLQSDQVAQIAIAQRTAMLTSFVLMAVNLVVAPKFAALYKQNKHAELKKLALVSVKFMVLFALPIVLMMLAFPEFIMSCFGKGLSSGGYLLQILVIGQFVSVVTGPVAFLLTMSGHERDFRNTVLISGPVAIILAFILTPWLGAAGSAIATATAVATQNLIAVYWVKKRLGFNTLAVWK